jgi:hypothetical protein
MDFLHWLSQISQSAAPPGQPFTPHWQYVALALLIPAVLGGILAVILKALEKAFGVKLGGGSI